MYCLENRILPEGQNLSVLPGPVKGGKSCWLGGRQSNGNVGVSAFGIPQPRSLLQNLPWLQQEGEGGSRHRAIPSAASLLLIAQLGNLLNLNIPKQPGKMVPESHFPLL